MKNSSSSGSRSVKLPDHFVALWAMLFGIVFISNLICHWPRAAQSDAENINIALALMRGEGFSNPFPAAPSGPTAHSAPLYPMLLAGIFWMFGTGRAASVAILVATTLAWSLQCALVQRFGALNGRLRAGTIAAFTLAFPPFHGSLLPAGAGEAFVAASVAGCACLFTVVMMGRTQRGFVALLGLTMAVATLFNPATLLIWIAWAFLFAWQRGFRRLAIDLVPAAIVFLIPIAAWTARNHAVLGHWIFVRGNFGLELAASYNNCGLTIISPFPHPPCYAPFHPINDPEVARRLSEIGEYSFYAQSGEAAKAWIRAHPLLSIAITAAHAFYFWFPFEHAGIESLIDGIGISILTLLSLLAVSWRRTDGFKIAVSGALAFSITYCFVRAVIRFRYPILWVTVFLMAVGIEDWLARRKGTG